ncbi:MAG: hypothetical protein MRERV_24c020 [Mycoplasmataceae bacterium RV_VA103A]|nr:MAG: hypothetical protein MRERV_24c020 [Mycoplasmataceae bacterium RV_VA103A]
MEPVSTTIAVSWLVGKIVLWAGTVAAGTYLGKKVIDKFGDTPGNNLNKLGIDHQKQWEEHQKWMTDKNKYIEEKTDEFFKSQKDRLKALEEENKQLAEALEKETDPQKKAQILDQIKNNRVEMKEIRREIADHINQINKNFTEIGRQGFKTQEQFTAHSQSPSLSSYKNWIIIVVVLILIIMVLKFIHGFLKKMLSGEK